jgi:hypothetical protein
MGKWKAIQKSPKAAIELFDLDTDLGETKDVAAAHPDVVKKVEADFKEAHVASENFPCKYD